MISREGGCAHKKGRPHQRCASCLTWPRWISSQIFMREILEQQLERKRLDKIRDAAVVIQRFVRTQLERRHFLAMRQSAIVVQTWVRRYLARKRYLTVRRGVVRAQANFRATRQRRLYQELRVRLPLPRTNPKRVFVWVFFSIQGLPLYCGHLLATVRTETWLFEHRMKFLEC